MKVGIVFFLVLLVAYIAEGHFQIIDNIVIAETDRYVIHFEYGSVTHLHNKLTAETYTSPSNEPESTGVLTWAGEIDYGDESLLWLKTHDFQVKQIDALTVRCQFSDKQTRGVIWLSIDPDTSDFIIQQQAVSKKASLASIAWQLRNLKGESFDVIVPSDGGFVINDANPRNLISFNYPSPFWEAQLVIGQKRTGGFSVRSTDNSFRYKQLTYSRESDHVSLSFTTENDAPFRDLTAIKSVQWRINAHRGNWQVPAGVYRDWMIETFNLREFIAERPSWVDDVNFYFEGAHGNLEIPKLLKVYGIAPEQTIFASVVADGADPSGDYQIKPGMKEFAKSVRDMGFPLVFVINARGVFPDEGTYGRFKKYQLIDPWSGKGHTYGTPGVSGQEWHIYVNPASLEWQNHFVRQIKRIFEEIPFDGVFLDVSHLVPNDHNADMYNMRAPHGARRLRNLLLNELPGIVLFGEWNHEVFLNQGSFVTDGLGIEGAHPISNFLFHPFIRSLSPRVRPTTEANEIYAYLDPIQTRNQLPGLYIWHAWQLDMTHPWHTEDIAHLEVRKLIKAVTLWQNDSSLNWVDTFRTTQPAVLYDVSGDGFVNILDLVMVANGMGYDRPDMNADGVVNILDLVIIANNLSK